MTITPEIIGAIVTLSGAVIAGWFAYLTKKAHARSPETVAGGYSALVSDLRLEMARLSERVQYLENERLGLTREVDRLNSQLQWLLNSISDDDRVEFTMYFDDEEPR